MPQKCSVPGCRGNYANGPKVSVFSFPAGKEQRDAWIRAMYRKDFEPSRNSKVCERHFQESQILHHVSAYDECGRLLTAPLPKPRLVEGAVPSIFPECPSYVLRDVPVNRENPEKRRERLENDCLAKAIQNSLETFEKHKENTSFNEFDEFVTKIKDYTFHKEWSTIFKENDVFILLLDETCQTKCAVKVSSDLCVSVYVRGVQIHKIENTCVVTSVSSLCELEELVVNLHKKFSATLNESEHVSLMNEILCMVETKFPSKKGIVSFVREQLALIFHKKVQKYSWELVVLSSLIHSISPHAYKFIRGSNNFILPSPRTIKAICSGFTTNPAKEKNKHFLAYMKSKMNFLGPKDKLLILSMDEVHLQPQFEYKQGTVVGAAFNSTECATGAYVFMVCSMLSSYKDVVHIVPVKNIDAVALFEIVKSVIEGLEDMGLEVMTLTSDNSALNRKAVSFFNNPPQLAPIYPHPKSPDRPLFFVFDTVHILKCIRNNWLNVHNQEFTFPHFQTSAKETASFNALKMLHSSEISNLLKYGVSLTLKALYPTSFEKQKVSLALQVFNESTAVALEQVGEKKRIREWESTAHFIRIVTQWWDVVNVKSLWKGQRKRNKFQEPITSSSCHVSFLKKFLLWLQLWETPGFNGLTRETHKAFTISTQALIQISEYLLNRKKVSFFLSGKIQTDNLEGRFGMYRQLCGSHYNISLMQLYEVESKLRVRSFLSFDESVKGTSHPTIVNLEVVFQDCIADESDVDNLPEEFWPLLYYISGYCTYSLSKRYASYYCNVFLTSELGEEDSEYCSLIHAANRGGLSFPHNDVVKCTSYVFIIMNKIVNMHKSDFFEVENQQAALIATTQRCLTSNVFVGFNCQYHDKGSMILCVLKIASNILLNNFVKIKNDTFKNRTMAQKKRKV